jgi:hypothetical protein
VGKGATSRLALLLVAAGLAACGDPNLKPALAEHVTRLGTRVVEVTRRALDLLPAGLASTGEIHSPGAACAVVVTRDVLVGIDAEGYATCRKAGLGCDFPAITGSAVRCDSAGQRMTAPEVVLGLSVVRAFSRFPDLLDMLSEVNVRDLENPRVVLTGGVTVEMGTGRYGTKIRRLRQILLRSPELGIRPTTVDMRFGRQAVVEYEKMKTQARKEV